jgi:hypothetical protein
VASVGSSLATLGIKQMPLALDSDCDLLRLSLSEDRLALLSLTVGEGGDNIAEAEEAEEAGASCIPPLQLPSR